MKNIKQKPITSLFIVLVLTLILSGCASKQDTSQPSVSEPTTRTIIDCSGAKVEIPIEVKTVIAPNQPFCSFMIAMGQGDKLIGSHGSVIGHTWAPLFKEDILDVELYGYKPEAEVLYKANADLIVVKNPTYAEKLRGEGLPAIYFAYNNIEELYYAVDLMSEIFGDDAKTFADKWKNTLNDTINTLHAELGSLSDSEKANVYYINGAVNPSTTYTTFGGGSFTEYWINSIGANLVTSEFENIEEIDQEVAIKLNPDTIFISGYAEYTRYDELVADPLWADIDAVKNDNIYLMPTSLVSFDRFAVELPLLLDYSANILYPEKHAFNGLEAFREFFKEFYGKDFSDEALNNMILGLNPDGTRMD